MKKIISTLNWGLLCQTFPKNPYSNPLKGLRMVFKQFYTIKKNQRLIKGWLLKIRLIKFILIFNKENGY